MRVRALVVDGTEVHVFPPSALYCQSWVLAPFSALATTSTDPSAFDVTAEIALVHDRELAEGHRRRPVAMISACAGVALASPNVGVDPGGAARRATLSPHRALRGFPAGS